MRKSKLQRIKDKFYWEEEAKKMKPLLNSYGLYRMGLTSAEIEDYIKARGNTLNIKKLMKKFDDICGCNTMAMTPTGECLMYRSDVERFADVLFYGTPTFFD